MEIVKTNEYYDTINFEKYVVTLIHQRFCSYSKRAFELIQNLSESPEFKKLSMKLLVLDLGNNDDFKSAEKIENVPIIYFYYNGIRVKYPLYDFELNSLINFLKIKKENPFVNKITTINQFNRIKNDNGCFLSTIIENKHKLKLFKSGFLKHPKEHFYKIIDEDLVNELKLEKNNIYYLKKGKPHIKYKKSFHHDTYEQWVDYLIYFSVININDENKLNKFKNEYNNIILIVYNKEDEDKLKNKVHNFLDLIISKLGLYFCNINDSFCDKALEYLNLKLEAGLYILKFDDRIDHPLIFNLKVHDFDENKIKEGITKYFNKELDYFEITEENLNKDIHLKNPNLYKVTRRTFPEYFSFLNKHDFVILFTSSKNIKRIKKINNMYSEITSKFQDRKHKIIFSYYFLDLNNHEFINTKDLGTPFVRVYPYGNMKYFVDLKFPKNIKKKIYNRIRNFIYDNCNDTLTKEDL